MASGQGVAPRSLPDPHGPQGASGLQNGQQVGGDYFLRGSQHGHWGSAALEESDEKAGGSNPEPAVGRDKRNVSVKAPGSYGGARCWGWTPSVTHSKWVCCVSELGKRGRKKRKKSRKEGQVMVKTYHKG